MERFTMLLKTVNPSISMDHFPWLCEITRGYIYICICTVYRIDIFPLPRLMTGWYFWLIYNRDILGTSWNHGSRQQPTVMLQPTKRVKLASWHFFLSQFEPPKNWQLVGGLEHFFIFHNIWDNPSHWLSYFSRWLLHRQPDCIRIQLGLLCLFHWDYYFGTAYHLLCKICMKSPDIHCLTGISHKCHYIP